MSLSEELDARGGLHKGFWPTDAAPELEAASCLFKGLVYSLVHFAKGCWDFDLLPTNGFSVKLLEVKLLAGEQNATEYCPEVGPFCGWTK